MISCVAEIKYESLAKFWNIIIYFEVYHGESNLCITTLGVNWIDNPFKRLIKYKIFVSKLQVQYEKQMDRCSICTWIYISRRSFNRSKNNVNAKLCVIRD